MNPKDCKHDNLIRIMGPIKADRRTRIGQRVAGLMKYECEACELVFEFKLHSARVRPVKR